MKRIFMLCGELSGDLLGAWYLEKRYAGKPNDYVEAIGGDALAQAGAHLFDRFETLNVVGVVEIVRHLPRLLGMMKKIVTHIVTQQFDELVLIDFPGFNLRIARQIKKIQPSIKITYLSPPQMWCWGAWRLKTLKQNVDEVVVLYPFEVGWYAQRGLEVSWLGNPVFDRLKKHMAVNEQVGKVVALLPGSRKKEIESLMPVFAEVVIALHKQFPELSFVLPRPASLPQAFMMKHLQQVGLHHLVMLIEDDEQKYSLLKRSCFALAKPGTVTLELGLLGIPAIVLYKTSALTYYLAKMVVRVQYMALPNLLMSKPVYPEFIQGRCRSELIVQAAGELYSGIKHNTATYQAHQQSLQKLRNLFSQQNIKN